MTNERLRILERIENGEITPEEGAKLLMEVEAGEVTASEAEALTPMRILEMIDAGEISPEEGARLLQGGESSEPMESIFSEEADTPDSEPEPARVEVVSAPDSERFAAAEPEKIERWQQWWMIPLWIGVGITVLSGLWMNSLLQKDNFGFWFYFSWLPLILGITLIALAWASRTAPWLHVRVKQSGESPENVAVSFPIPLRLSAWVLRTFGGHISGLDNTNVDEIITAIDLYATSKQPIYIQVDVDEDGEHVEVFIG
ncbi:MAG: SHOCT-like domain-containing protein [Anaerolineales bacterium]